MIFFVAHLYVQKNRAEISTWNLVPHLGAESDVLVGTNQLLVPPDTEPLHFTRFVVYTQLLNEKEGVFQNVEGLLDLLVYPKIDKITPYIPKDGIGIFYGGLWILSEVRLIVNASIPELYRTLEYVLSYRK